MSVKPPFEVKTESQVKEEIAKLTDMKPHVLSSSFFGDDHHDAIDAQINVLENDLDEQDVEDSYGDEDSDEFAQNVYDEAGLAARWRHGFEKESPSVSWIELDTRKKG